MQLQAKQKHHKFKFKCTKCGQCCDKTIISLYPFDIKIICDRLNITPAQFHENYSAFTLDEESIIRCFLRNRPRCPFKSQDSKCTIYSSRPVRCRLYPIGRYFTEEEVVYLIANDPSPGFNSNKRQSIAEWLTKQGVDDYDSLVFTWNRFLIGWKGHPLVKNPEVQQRFKDTFYKFELSGYSEGSENSLSDDYGTFMSQLYEGFTKYLASLAKTDKLKLVNNRT